MPKVLWRKLGDYSGPLIYGTARFSSELATSHLERAVWLTSMVETGGTFGTVVGYDGTGITAGLTQTVSVFPRTLDPGPLWELIAMVRDSSPEVLSLLDKEMAASGWEVCGGGLHKLGETCLSSHASGKYIRNKLTPLDGRVPSSGQYWEQAAKWARILSGIFSSRATFQAQINFAIEQINAQVARKRDRLDGRSIDDLLYRPFGSRFDSLTELDLAACFFWCNFINAPSVALDILRLSPDACCIANKMSPSIWWPDPTKDCEVGPPAVLIRLLGTSNHGRWNHSLSNGRYQRARKAALQIWPEDLVHKIMPEKL